MGTAVALKVEPDSLVVQAGEPQGPSLTVWTVDGYGNPLFDYDTATRPITARLPQAPSYRATWVVTRGVARIASVAVPGLKIGLYELSLVSPTLAPAVVGLGIVVGKPTMLALRQQPSGLTYSGVPLEVQPVVELRDAAGNAVTNVSGYGALVLQADLIAVAGYDEAVWGPGGARLRDASEARPVPLARVFFHDGLFAFRDLKFKVRRGVDYMLLFRMDPLIGLRVDDVRSCFAASFLRR